MKILHIIDSGGLYGAEIMLLNLVQEQIKIGLEPTICSIGGKGIVEKPLESEATKRGVRVEKFRMSPGPNLIGVFKILKYAKKEQFDILHSHGYKGNILFGFIPKSYRRIPLITTLHGWTSTKALTKMKLYEWLDAKSLKHIDAVVAVNRVMFMHHMFKNNGHTNLFVVNNGIPALNFTTGKMEHQKNCDLNREIIEFCQDSFIIGSIGRLSKEKGFNNLVESVYELNKIGLKAKLIIIGEGYERDNLEKLIMKLGMKDNVLMPGYENEAWQYLPLFDVFALPSLTEGFPITILEAMQSGVPIVATRVGGVPEILDEGAAGVLVKPGDVKVLTQEILSLLKNPTCRTNIAKKAKEIAFTRYSDKNMALEYQKIYMSLVKTT